MNFVHAVDGGLFFLGISCPRNGNAPVEVRSNGVAVFVFGNFKQVVARVSRVCQPLANDGVAHPENKLFVLRIGDLGFVHPEIIYRNAACGNAHPPQRIDFARAHLIRTARNEHHIVWRGFVPDFSHGNTREFAAHAAADAAAAASEYGCK